LVVLCKKLPPNFKKEDDMITLEDIYDVVRDNEKKLDKILELLEEKKDE
jgi:spermidine synthase